jgi:hypothetical protein
MFGLTGIEIASSVEKPLGDAAGMFFGLRFFDVAKAPSVGGHFHSLLGT